MGWTFRLRLPRLGPFRLTWGRRGPSVSVSAPGVTAGRGPSGGYASWRGPGFVLSGRKGRKP